MVGVFVMRLTTPLPPSNTGRQCAPPALERSASGSTPLMSMVSLKTPKTKQARTNGDENLSGHQRGRKSPKAMADAQDGGWSTVPVSMTASGTTASSALNSACNSTVASCTVHPHRVVQVKTVQATKTVANSSQDCGTVEDKELDMPAVFRGAAAWTEPLILNIVGTDDRSNLEDHSSSATPPTLSLPAGISTLLSHIIVVSKPGQQQQGDKHGDARREELADRIEEFLSR